MKTIEELEQERQEFLAENKRRAEVMLGAEYVIENDEVVCSNVEHEHSTGDWGRNYGFKGLIIAQDNDEVLVGTIWASFASLRQYFTRPDGSRFEKEKKQ